MRRKHPTQLLPRSARRLAGLAGASALGAASLLVGAATYAAAQQVTKRLHFAPPAIGFVWEF